MKIKTVYKHVGSFIGKSVGALAILTLTLGSFGALFTSPQVANAATGPNSPITQAATNITQTDASLNGTGGPTDATDHTFWASLTPIDVSNPNVVPTGVFSTPSLGPIASSTPFTALLSTVNGLGPITASTTYYFAAWSQTDGTWSSGDVLNFTTLAAPVPPAPTTAKVTIAKYIDGVHATALSASSSDFQMNADYTISSSTGSGQYALSAAGYNGNPTPYEAQTSDLPLGSDYATNEIFDSVTGATESSSTLFSFVGYTSGDSIVEAAAATPTSTSPHFTNISSDKFIIVWNKSFASTTGTSTGTTTGGTIGGDVTGGVSTSTVGVLHVDSITAVDSTATADGTFTNGWKYIFNLTVPSNETHLSMKFADWTSTVGSTTIAAGNNMRISSAQADNAGATVPVVAANTYTLPTLNLTGDLNTAIVGKQVKITVEVAIPSTTVNGAYTTSYGVNSI